MWIPLTSSPISVSNIESQRWYVSFAHGQRPVSQSQKVCNYKDNLYNYNIFLILFSQYLRFVNPRPAGGGPKGPAVVFRK